MTAEEWVSLIGYRKANRLFLKYGGCNVHIPKKPKAEHPLALLLGLETLEKLSDEYPSQLVFVPRMSAALEDFAAAFGLPPKTRCRKSFFFCPLQKTLF